MRHGVVCWIVQPTICTRQPRRASLIQSRQDKIDMPRRFEYRTAEDGLVGLIHALTIEGPRGGAHGTQLSLSRARNAPAS